MTDYSGDSMTVKKKLIEVALPLDAINIESLRRKQKAPKGFPTSFHKWWAQRPLAACRAVLFASLIDDPSAQPDIFPSETEQNAEREHLLELIRELIKWENSQNEHLLAVARKKILDSTNGKPPLLCDPFCGSGSIPLEAQRLGIESYASDLNPVAVLINKALIEIPPKFAGHAPVNTKAHTDRALIAKTWRGAQGLAEDVRYYGQWMRDEAEKRIGRFYPKIEISDEIAKERLDLKPLVGHQLTVVAWLWTRTVKSPNPAVSQMDVPLASTFMLSTKAGKEAYVEPVVEGNSYHFTVKVGKPKDDGAAKNGTKLARGSNFRCLMSDAPIQASYIRSEAQAGRMGVRLMAIVADSEHGRVYVSPTPEHEAISRKAQPMWKPELKVPTPCHDVDRLPMYGMPTWGDVFTLRQLMMLTTLSDLSRSQKVFFTFKRLQPTPVPAQESYA
jgi:putative DNA methylase